MQQSLNFAGLSRHGVAWLAGGRLQRLRSGNRNDALAQLFDQMARQAATNLPGGAAVVEYNRNSERLYSANDIPRSQLGPHDVLIDQRLLNRKQPVELSLGARNAELAVGQAWIGGYLTNRNSYGYRKLSRAEALGRLYAYGFEVSDLKTATDDSAEVFLARKVSEPVLKFTPSRGPIIRLERVGQQGQPVHVYKFRTMHPYSEYLQGYIYQHNKLAAGGKFKNDFRITRIGKVLRRYWLDELPMLFNFLKGDLKLVGVRPLSRQYLSLYPRDAIEKRQAVKPGLLASIYVDQPNTLEEVVASEMRYIDAYQKLPMRTDVRYFFLVLDKIFRKKLRSH